MLVVATITLVAVAMMLPAATHARQSARRTVCQGNFRQIYPAIAGYAVDHNGNLFRHYESELPDAAGYWDRDSPNYIPPEQRSTEPIADPQWPASGQWPWAEPAGPRHGAGFLAAIHPYYLSTPSLMDCPSLRQTSAMSLRFLPSTFEGSRLAPYYRSSTGPTPPTRYLMSYFGAVFGRFDAPASQRGHGFWTSYYVQGYYPYSDEYRTPRGALLSDVGDYSFYFGTGAAWPDAGDGCHKIGGNDLFVDGSVIWRNYSWESAID
jgi:hypothetical protein